MAAMFRMALLSGEVETLRLPAGAKLFRRFGFRMALLSGEVETGARWRSPGAGSSSGWLCYPGKLKQPLLADRPVDPIDVPDGFAIRGS